MLLFSLLDYTSFLIFLYLGIYVFRREPGTAINKIFLAQSLSFALWALCDTFIHSTSSLETVWVLERISTIGYATFAAFVLHFFLEVSGRKVSRKPLILAFIYAPALIFLFRGLYSPLAVSEFVPGPLGWSEILPSSSGWYIAFSIYYLAYMVTSIALSLHRAQTTKNIRERNQSRVLTLSALAPLLGGIITDVIVPQMNIRIPPLTPILILFWAFGVWYVIRRYHFMVISPEMAVHEIVRQMDNMMFFLDEKGQITRINDQVTNVMISQEEELLGRPFMMIVQEDADIVKILEDTRRDPSRRYSSEVHLKISTGITVPIRLFATAIKDKNNYLMGILIIGIDLRETRALQNEITERKKAEALLQDSESKLRQRKEEIEKDLQSAKLIEKALIRSDSVNLPGVQLALRHKTMDIIGGDYFTSIKIDEETTGFFISDVAGHGISAALFLSLISSTVHRVAEEYGKDPSAFMEQLNHELIQYMSSYFLTAIYSTVIVQPDSALFTFARGGHPFPVLISQGRFEMLKGRGPMVGQFPGIQFEKVTCELRSGDRLFLYTDGLIEVSNRQNDLFGFKRFAELLLSSSHLPLENAMDRIMDEIRSFRGLSEVEDDMLITCIEYTGLE